MKARSVFEDLATLQLAFILPQPIYYIICEFIKICGDYGDFFYPSTGTFIAQLLLIVVLYLPSIALFVFNRRMVRTCIRRSHPYYDFETHQIYQKVTVEAPSAPSNPPQDDQNGLLSDQIETQSQSDSISLDAEN